MKIKLILAYSLLSVGLMAQQPWENRTYSDETGFICRTAGAIEKISKKGYGIRSLAPSVCPDTGLPVYNWAVEGEEIISPYTGRRYKQGPTGYFGPKERNGEGEITAFGGDPLKYDLDPVTATLMLNPTDTKASGFVGVWGNMIQQYHFGAANWARFYGLFGRNMDMQWRTKFQKAVESYFESRRPSDGDREHDPLPRPYNLLGFPDEKEGLLGGGFRNGGTENHKTMWRASALVYADLFPESAKISGFTVPQVKEIVPGMFHKFFRRILEVSNGEYDSHIYYPHAIYGFLNMYDFGTPEHSEMAKFILDYYLITYGLKCVDNTIAGAQKRGYLSTLKPGEMETYMWVWSGAGSKNMNERDIHLHQATTTYRPNRIIQNIIGHKLKYPFEAKMSRPTYHMNIGNAFQESFYRSHSYALGNVAMTMVDNPNQQIVWSLVAEGKDGPLCFGGQQPYRMSPTGHSQYTQTMQSKSALILMTGQTGKKPGRKLTDEENARFEHAGEKLMPLIFPAEPDTVSVKKYFSDAKLGAASWLFIPKKIDRLIEKEGIVYIQANKTLLAVTPLGKYQFIRETDLPSAMDPVKVFPSFDQYFLLSVYGDTSGYIVEAAEFSEYGSLDNFISKYSSEKHLKLFSEKNREAEYETLQKEVLHMQYIDTGLRARAGINGVNVDYDKWADGYVYNSPYVKSKDGILYVTDGEEGYKVDYTGTKPVYNLWKP